MGTGYPRAQAARGSGRGLGESAHHGDSPRDQPHWEHACEKGQERVLGPERLPLGTGVEAGRTGPLLLPKPLVSTSPPGPYFSITVEKKARFQLWGPLAQPDRSWAAFPLTSQAALIPELPGSVSGACPPVVCAELGLACSTPHSRLWGTQLS